jgi:YD repeat-containing protein
LASLEVLPDKSVMVVGPEGLTHFAVKAGGGFEAPEGDQNLTLEYDSSKGAYFVKDPKEGSTTEFTLPAGAESWLPTVSEGPVATDKLTDEYKTIKPEPGHTIVEPTLELAAHSTATCARERLERGCRALEFVYDEGPNTATGEAEGEWGSYKNRLKEVIVVAYNPGASPAKMERRAVAAYEYDEKGRLRAEWNPQIQASTDCGKVCPALKTIYGYDAEGHVTAVTPPGQGAWALTYGTIAGDPTSGRLLKVTRARASAPLWKGGLPSNTTPPGISGSPIVGVILAASHGTWSGEPVVYGYQWEDCNAEGKQCAPILGATNPNYKVAPSDGGHTLIATITATSGGGSVAVSAAASTAVPATEYALPEGSEPEGITEGPNNTIWLTDALTGRISELTLTGKVTEYELPPGSDPDGITDLGVNGITKGSEGSLWFTAAGSSRIDKMTTTGGLSEYVLPSGSEPEEITVGPEGNLWYTDYGTSKIGKITPAGQHSPSEEYSLPSGSHPWGIAASSDGSLWYTDTGTGEIGKISASGKKIEEYKLPAGSQPYNIALGPDGNMWYTNFGTSAIGKIPVSGTPIEEYKLPPASEPFGITAGSDGNLRYTDKATNNVGKIPVSGKPITEYSLPQGSEPYDITQGPGNELWYTDTGSDKVGRISTSGSSGTEAAPIAPQPGATIDYNVPLSGAGLPTLTASEVSKWGQTDVPVEATAIFPPEEPQSWPATAYTRASINYMDVEARTVNVASPSGAITTQEYNKENEVTRSLSAPNREAVVSAANPGEASGLLDTKSTYNGEGQLTDTWGPQHTVKLAVGETKTGEEVSARNHVKYFYDEGAPSGESFGLITKEIDGAETASGKEFDKRTTVTSYSGQEGLGWTLRQPTAVVTEPGGANRRHETVYERETGAVLETKSPGAFTNTFTSEFATGQSEASAVAVNAEGDYWVSDFSTGTPKEFNASGTTVLRQLSVSLAAPCRGSLTEAVGIAVAPGGGVWVTDRANDRVLRFSSEGKCELEFGSKGQGAGKFENPQGLAVRNGHVWITSGCSVDEYSEAGVYLSQIAAGGCDPWGVAVAPGGQVWVSDIQPGAVKTVQEYTEAGKRIQSLRPREGNPLSGWMPMGLAVNAEGDVFVTTWINNKVEEFAPDGEYLTSIGSCCSGSAKLNFPIGVAIDSRGDVVVADQSDGLVKTWQSNEQAHTTKTVYYVAAPNSSACGNRIEWQGLPCEVLPEEQPAATGLPSVPVSTYRYNLWDQAEAVEEAVADPPGTISTRTKLTTFDSAGRPLTSDDAISGAAANAVTSLPTVTAQYNGSTGMRESEVTGTGANTKTITSSYDSRGQLASYTDADGNTATYTYDEFGRVTKLNDGAPEHKGEQTYGYDEVTGTLNTLVDAAAGTFTARYSPSGQLTSETYPNGMTAYYSYNATGAATGLEYKKLTHCPAQCTWFSDSIVPSIHGETLKQVSTLSEEPNYTYNEAGLLTEVQEVPSGEGCNVRAYAYNVEGDRTQATTRAPSTSSTCATQGGTPEVHAYDTANRMTDPGIVYEAFGNTTTLPAADAGGHEIISSYYADGQVYKQSENGETSQFGLDPEGRTRETISDGKTATSVVSHYDGPGNGLAWTAESPQVWTRNIPGIAGELAAVETADGTELQLHDLQGNIVATAALGEEASALVSKFNSTEFGVPTSTTPPPKYAWLGAGGVASEPLGGTGAVTQDGETYIPQTARPLQTLNVEVPVPANVAAVYVNEPSAIGLQHTLEAASKSLSKYEEQGTTQGGAGAPAGTVPSSDGECAGDNACAATVHHHPGVAAYHERGNGYAGCEVWASYGAEGGTAGISGEIEVFGHWHCEEAVPMFELQIALLIMDPENGKWVMIGAAYTEHYFNVNGDGGLNNSNDFQCGPEHALYDAWVFGRQYDGRYHARWWGWGREAEVRTSCHGGVSSP